MKSRNPIARVIRRIRHQVIPDKRAAAQDKILDSLAMFDRLGEMELQSILKEVMDDNGKRTDHAPD